MTTKIIAEQKYVIRPHLAECCPWRGRLQETRQGEHGATRMPKGPFQAKKSSQAHAAIHAWDGKLPLFRASSISFS